LFLLQELLSVKIEFASVATCCWFTYRFPLNDAFGTTLQFSGAAKVPHFGGADKQGIGKWPTLLCVKPQRLQ
jgi:hypothetical protein